MSTAAQPARSNLGAKLAAQGKVVPELQRKIDHALASVPQGDERIPILTRALEIGVASVVLLLTAPIQLTMAFLIRRGTPGPALFHQKRIGLNGRLFDFVKFRTLYADARQRWPHMYEYNYSEDQVATLMYKHREDPRVTPQGRWMRFSSLDELPNFWNVLKGEIALVGPRPEIPEMLPYYTPEDLKKFSVRPGITGLAQISGRSLRSFREVVALDLEYIERRSVTLDLKILFRTILKTVTRDGAF